MKLEVCCSRLHGACSTIVNIVLTDDALRLGLRVVMPAAFPQQACAGNETSGNATLPTFAAGACKSSRWPTQRSCLVASLLALGCRSYVVDRLTFHACAKPKCIEDFHLLTIEPVTCNLHSERIPRHLLIGREGLEQPRENTDLQRARPVGIGCLSLLLAWSLFPRRQSCSDRWPSHA